MGTAAKIFLVILALMLPGRLLAASEFWLWPGAQLPPDADIQRLYLLQGFFAGRGVQPAFVDQGASPRSLRRVRELMLVYRLDALQPAEPLAARMTRDARAWQRLGNRVMGVQLDFDAATGHLADYTGFLADIRRQLPREYSLSITGLLDWLNQSTTASVAGVVDELVLQTYQGRQNVANLETYLQLLGTRGPPFAVPFKLGWVEGASRAVPDSVSRHPLFRGHVIFLLQ